MFIMTISFAYTYETKYLNKSFFDAARFACVSEVQLFDGDFVRKRTNQSFVSIRSVFYIQLIDAHDLIG